MLDSQDVVDAYVAFLGRVPESQSVIDDKLRRHSTWLSLAEEFLASKEFLRRLTTRLAGSMRGSRLNPDVQSEVVPSVLAEMLDRTTGEWARLGEEEPYWSVLSSPRFERSNFDQHSKEFWDSGRSVNEVLDRLALKAGISIGNDACLELGCGVGRMTRFLAERFDHVYAVDISPGNLAIAARAVQGSTGRVSARLLRTFEDLDSVPKVDVFVSFIVLQHNPPPVQRRLLETAFSRLRPGGVAVFQLVAGALDYRFDASTPVSRDRSGIEMHCLPFDLLLTVIRDSQMECLDIEMDDWASAFGLSVTVLARKRP